MNEFTATSQESSMAQTEIYFPYEISYADCDPSPATTEKIEARLAKLKRYYDRITDCKVIVRIPHRHGSLRHFHVHIQLDVPGKRLAVSRDLEPTDEATDINYAIKIAFAKILHQLVEFTHARNESKAGKRH